MGETPVSAGGGPRARGWSLGSVTFWLATMVAASAALVGAFWGWSIQYTAELQPTYAGKYQFRTDLQAVSPQTPNVPSSHAMSTAPPAWVAWERLALRSVRALGPQDLELPQMTDPARLPLGLSQAFGMLFTYLLASRLLLIALGSRMKEMLISWRGGKFDVVVGGGQAAMEYAALAERRTTHTAFGLPVALGVASTMPRAGTLKRQLSRAAAGRARSIVIDEGDDAVTWQTAQGAAKLYPNVHVLAHIRDPWIHERLSRTDAAASLRTFSYANGVARQLMLAHPPYLLARRYKAPAQHILIFGFGAVGQALAKEFLITSVSNNPRPMMITAIDPVIDDHRAEFLGRLPGLGEDVSLGFIRGDLRLREADALNELRARLAISPACAVYIAIGDSSLPLSFGLDMREQAIDLGVMAPIFICAQHGAGFPELAAGSGLVGQGVGPAVTDEAARTGVLCDRRLASFGQWRNALDGMGLFEDRSDGLAKGFHESYLMKNPPNPDPARRLPSEVDWNFLPDQYRVSNRRAAAHVRAKIDAAGYKDLDDWLAKGPRYKSRGRNRWLTDEFPADAFGLFQLDNKDFLESMAELEHRRWMIERALNGWQFGEPRDDATKRHNCMVAYDKLPEDDKQKDRDNISLVASILKTLSRRQRPAA